MRTKINICLLIIIFLPLGLQTVLCQQDQITITTYFPAPWANYRWLRTQRIVVGPRAWPVPGRDGDLVWGIGTSKGQLSADQGASIELGGNGGFPYIDFSNDMSTFPFEHKARINLSDMNTLKILSTGGSADPDPVANRAAVTIYDDNTANWRDLYVKCLKYHWGWIPVGVPPDGTICRADLIIVSP